MRKQDKILMNVIIVIMITWLVYIWGFTITNEPNPLYWLSNYTIPEIFAVCAITGSILLIKHI